MIVRTRQNATLVSLLSCLWFVRSISLLMLTCFELVTQGEKDNDEYRRSNRIAHMIDDDSGDGRGVLGAGVGAGEDGGENGGDIVKEVERRDVEGRGEKGGSGGEGKASASADLQVEVDVPQSGAVDSTVGDVFVCRNKILNGTSNKVPSCVSNGFPSGTDNGVRSGVVHGEMNAVVSGVVGGVMNGVVSADTSGGASRKGSGGDSVTSPVPTAVGPLLRKRDSETGLILRARSISTDVSTRSQQNSFLNGDKGSERGGVGREMLSGSGRSSISLTSKSPLKGLSVGGTLRIAGDKETDRKMHFLLVDGECEEFFLFFIFSLNIIIFRRFLLKALQYIYFLFCVLNFLSRVRSVISMPAILLLDSTSFF